MNDINEIKNEDYENSHRFLAEEVLIPNANKTDANRSTMFCSHLAQAITLKHSEPPLVYTNFENQVGQHSTVGYKKANANYQVIKKINKNRYNYIMIVQNTETKEYHYFNRNECEWLTEHYGFKWNNELIDSLEEEDILETDDVLYRNDCYDENMNFGYGVNLNAVYFTYANQTLEDACVISESAAKKLTSYSVKKLEVTVNTNDILLNLYGDDVEYKCFPDLGEEIKNQIITARRRVNYETMIYELKNTKDLKENDTPFYTDGKIVDIEIFSNMDEEELEKQTYNSQIKKYIRMQDKYSKEIYTELKDIVENKSNKISDELIHLYNNHKKRIDENSVFVHQKSEFNGFIIHFTVLEEEALNKGSKITGRFVSGSPYSSDTILEISLTAGTSYIL
ncbi:DNA-directed RNA polymerase beta subunit [Bacillus phage vB_BpuM-BpSp]|nr:DNA-directed RNA polymerase beta subunit [Bacillus phage vB_BpuM-BpSp]